MQEDNIFGDVVVVVDNVSKRKDDTKERIKLKQRRQQQQWPQ
jgi:hypothetical protein